MRRDRLAPRPRSPRATGRAAGDDLQSARIRAASRAADRVVRAPARRAPAGSSHAACGPPVTAAPAAASSRSPRRAAPSSAARSSARAAAAGPPRVRARSAVRSSSAAASSSGATAAAARCHGVAGRRRARRPARRARRGARPKWRRGRRPSGPAGGGSAARSPCVSISPARSACVERVARQAEPLGGASTAPSSALSSAAASTSSRWRRSGSGRIWARNASSISAVSGTSPSSGARPRALLVGQRPRQLQSAPAGCRA